MAPDSTGLISPPKTDHPAAVSGLPTKPDGSVPSQNRPEPTYSPGIALEDAKWNIYHPESGHLWNRLFRHLYRRTDKDGREYGWDSLDPLLWYETAYLLEGDSHLQAIQLLDEFLSFSGEDLIGNPLKRALFQRDMWAVFDWLAFRSDNFQEQRRALQERLAQVIQRLALTEQEILSLPDNYEAAVRSKAFPAHFQSDNPQAAFLPDSVFKLDSGWVLLGRKGGPLAMSHTEEFPFFGRSVFLAFIRVPGGRAATLSLLQELNTDRSPALTAGTEVALVRRMALIDQNGYIVLSPITESVQVRRFSPAQFFYEFNLSRAMLFDGVSGGLRAIDNEFMLFRSHGVDLFAIDLVHEVGIPERCMGCHFGEGFESILSYSRARFPLPNQKQPKLFESTQEKEAQAVRAWKLLHPSWQSLEAMWKEGTVTSSEKFTFDIPATLAALPEGPSPERTKAVLQAFFDAYRRGDVEGVLATLSDPFAYSDCDFEAQMMRLFESNRDLAEWLTKKFAEQDRFLVEEMTIGPPEGSPPNDPRLATVQVSRASISLESRTWQTRSLFKIVLNSEGDRIQFLNAYGNINCEAGR